MDCRNGGLLLGAPLIALIAVGCDDSPSHDPCEPITCSNHGTCEVLDEAPRCRCDEGYHARGLSCIEASGADADADADLDPVDGDPDVDDASSCELDLCHDECVDLQSDNDHCGRCNHSCERDVASSTTCREGRCQCPVEGERPCGGRCVDVNTNRDHCGECDTPCVEAAEVCREGSCCEPNCNGLACGTVDACVGPCGPGSWVLITPGAFEMGSPAREIGQAADEDQHQVTLTYAYQMLSTEVTPQILTDIEIDPSDFTTCGTNCPITDVSWDQAAAVANAMSVCADLERCYSCTSALPDVECTTDFTSPTECVGFRLPTEAEWEYAARAGTTEATYNGNFESEMLNCETNPVLEPIAHWCEDHSSQPSTVAELDPNRWGLYDMLGNVSEWCEDLYFPYPTDTVVNPVELERGTARVHRGGGYSSNAQSCRAAARLSASGAGSGNIGMRLVRTIRP